MKGFKFIIVFGLLIAGMYSQADILADLDLNTCARSTLGSSAPGNKGECTSDVSDATMNCCYINIEIMSVQATACIGVPKGTTKEQFQEGMSQFDSMGGTVDINCSASKIITSVFALLAIVFLF